MHCMSPSGPKDYPISTLRPARDRPRRTAAFELARVDATSWRESSFDLAQGLEVKVMQSKLSAETLHRLFGS